MPTVTSRDGTKIAYIREGNGPAVVLVGGALQYKSDQLMGSLLPLLAAEFTVVSYDRRGRGESGNTNPYTIEREVEDLEAIIKEFGGTAFIFGMSSGGTLALLAASKLSSIKKVATYEAPFIIEKQLSNSASEYIAALKKAIATDTPGTAVKLFMKRIGMPTPVILIMQLTPFWSKLKALAPTLVHDALIVGDGSVSEQLSLITVPVLLITGTSERMKEASKDVLKVVPAAQYQVLEGQSHNVKPIVLAPALSNFFKGI